MAETEPLDLCLRFAVTCANCGRDLTWTQDQDPPPDVLPKKSQAACLRASVLKITREDLEEFVGIDATAWMKPQLDKIAFALEGIEKGVPREEAMPIAAEATV